MPADKRNDIERNTPSQPGPMPNDGRASKTRKWVVTAAIVAVLLAVMYGVTTHRAEVKDERHQTDMQRDAAPPAPAQPGKPGGRASANAPPATKPGG